MPASKTDRVQRQKKIEAKNNKILAASVIERIGGEEALVSMFVENLESKNPYVRKQAQKDIYDMVLKSNVADEGVEVMEDDDIEEELTGYVSRILIDMRQEDYARFIEDVNEARLERARAIDMRRRIQAEKAEAERKAEALKSTGNISVNELAEPSIKVASETGS